MSFGFGFGLPSQLYLIGSPTLNLNLAGATVLDPIVTFTRASSASYYNSLGLLSTASTNTPRFDYNPATLAAQGLLVEEQRTNLLTYSENFDNAAWTKFGTTSVAANATTSITGNVDADRLTIDVSSGIYQIISSAAATTYTLSIWIKADSAQSVNFIANTNLSEVTTLLVSVTTSWQRVTLQKTTTTGSALTFQVSAAGAAATVYIYGAQLEAGAFPTSYIPSTNTFTSRASTGSYIDATGTLQSAAINVARNTYNPANLVAAPFLLLEESRTNSIRNNTMVGAVAGTPGTDPTNWSYFTTLTGLTRTIVGTGTESGIAYMDFRISGTPSAAGNFDIIEEAVSSTPALTGQTWSKSQYLKLVSGSLTGISSIVTRYNEYTSASAFISGQTTAALPNPTSAALSTQRTSTSMLLNGGATTAYLLAFTRLVLTGVAIDITLRIGLPQLEQGYGATSVIPNSPTFTSRASAATYYNSAGLLTSAGTNVARLNYNPANLTQPANLILENAATNLLTYSSEFNNAAWGKISAAVSSQYITAPDGTLNGSLWTELTATSQHLLSQSIGPVVAGTKYTFSIYAKAYTQARQLTLTMNAGGYPRFDLVTGTVVSSANFDSATITPVGNGWYRCSVTAGAFSTDGTFYFGGYNTTNNYTGDGVSGFYVWGAQIELGAFPTTYIPSTNTFTSRASTGSYFDSSGVLQSAAINVARNTYNPANLSAAPFLLLEEARTNLLTYSSEFNNAAWTKDRSSITANTIVAPDGSLTGDKLVEDTTASNTHIILQSQAGTATAVHTFSVYAKAGERTRMAVQIDAGFGASGGYAVFDLSLGLYDPPSGTGSPAASITHVGNGWYRCVVTATPATSGSSVRGIIYLVQSGGVTSYTGNGVSGLYIYGAQLEAGAYPTSYIPTTTTALTRSADVSSSATTTRAADVYSQAALTRSADVSSSAQATRAADVAPINTLSPWFNASEGTLYVEGSRLAAGLTSGVIAGFSQTLTFNQSMYMSNDIGTGNVLSMNVINGGVAQAGVGGPVATGITNTFKAAFSYATNNFAGAINGATTGTDVSGTVPTPMQNLTIGSAPWLVNGTTNWSGYIRRITYYPRYLSNTERQSLTT